MSENHYKELVTRLNGLTTQWATEMKFTEELDNEIKQMQPKVVSMRDDWNILKKGIIEMNSEFLKKHLSLLGINKIADSQICAKPVESICNIEGESSCKASTSRSIGIAKNSSNTWEKELLNNVQIKAVGSIQKKIKIVLLAVADKTGTAAAVCSDNSWLFFNALNSTPLKKIYKKKCLDLLCWVIPQKRIESCGRGFVFLTQDNEIIIVDALSFEVIDNEEFFEINKILRRNLKISTHKFQGSFIIPNSFNSPGNNPNTQCYLIYANGMFLFYHPTNSGDGRYLIASPDQELLSILRKHIVVGATAINQSEFVIWTTYDDVSFSACCEYKNDPVSKKLLWVLPLKNKEKKLLEIELPKGEIFEFEDAENVLVYKTLAKKLQAVVPQEWAINASEPTPHTLLSECFLDDQEIYTFCHQEDFLIILGKSDKPECVTLRIFSVGERRLEKKISVTATMKFTFPIVDGIPLAIDKTGQNLVIPMENGHLKWIKLSKFELEI